MNYWVTTHYPPTVDDIYNDLTDVWIVDGKQKAAEKLKSGDIVLIYQTKTGKSEIKQNIDGSRKIVNRIKGKEGIVSVTKVKTKLLKNPEFPIIEYVNGEKKWWCWHAETEKITTSGFVSREDLNLVLGYKKTNVLKGFGDKNSGIKLITKNEFEQLLTLFKKNQNIKNNALDTDKKYNNKKRKNKKFSFEESKEHLNLKNYIAQNPTKVLKEGGVITIAKEYLFPTMDKADLVLEDYFGRIIGLEVEVNVEDGQIQGILQAIKYRYMLELMKQRNIGESRAILVAYTISPRMKKLCEQYNVECIAVKKKDVDQWCKINNE